MFFFSLIFFIFLFPFAGWFQTIYPETTPQAFRCCPAAGLRQQKRNKNNNNDNNKGGEDGAKDEVEDEA